MSAQQFVDTHGIPQDAIRLDDTQLDRYRGRVPDDLIDLWRIVGFGAYADGNYWLCEPGLFDPYLPAYFGTLDEFVSADVAAFGYSCLGMVDLWQRSGRHLTFDLATGLLMDLTSLRQTANVPYDVEGLMGMAGIAPEFARETFLASRAKPQDVWISLGSAVDKEGYRLIYSDSGKQLIRELRRDHGRLQPGEIYFRREMFKNEPDSYEKLSINAAFNLRPSNVRFTHYVELDGHQQSLEVISPIR
jgi:GAD-like domain